MKKSTSLLIAVLTVAMFWMCSSTILQAQPTPTKQITIQTRYMIPMSPDQRTELNGLLKEYFDKVTNKNEFILQQINMNHHYTDDSREFITITEYASWADIAKGNDRNYELENMAWPDETKRNAFLGKIASYFTYHKDGVYNELDDMEKH